MLRGKRRGDLTDHVDVDFEVGRTGPARFYTCARAGAANAGWMTSTVNTRPMTGVITLEAISVMWFTRAQEASSRPQFGPSGNHPRAVQVPARRAGHHQRRVPVRFRHPLTRRA